jgi:hypothetical protein
MARSYANLWSRLATGLTAAAHTRASVFRWVVLLALLATWIWSGLIAWGDRGPLEAIYRTISAIGMYDDYFDADTHMLELARFAGITVPIVGLLFAFSGALGRNLAQAFNLGAAKHVVIAGGSPAALSLALDCRRRDDSVILIAPDLADDTALDLRRRGVIVLHGDGAHGDTLRAARAHHAAHVVAFAEDDTANLQIEAAVRRLVGNSRRRPPIGVHVATNSAMLLREAREMRSTLERKKSASKAPRESIDPKPFSVDEIAARNLIQREAQTMLSLGEQLGRDKLHIVFFGFDAAAETLAGRILMSMWSARFGSPRITVLAPNAAAAESKFKTRHAEAFAHAGLWAADIAFLPFDWDEASVNGALLDSIESQRGKPVAAVVSTGADPANIHLGIALRRACNHSLRWPIPVFMRESAQSEFSRQYAKGDETPELDAYLQAVGAHQVTATRAKILDGLLDRGAAIAHEHYNLHLGERDPMSLRELQAAMRSWPDVLETYRAANRAVADAAMVKLWDAGWRPALPGEKGETAPTIPDDKLSAMARVEHDRWMAERLLSGWRPTMADEKRNNELMSHDKLVGWDALTDDDKARDEVQVRAALDIARVLHPQGFVARDVGAASVQGEN